MTNSFTTPDFQYISLLKSPTSQKLPFSIKSKRISKKSNTFSELIQRQNRSKLILLNNNLHLKNQSKNLKESHPYALPSYLQDSKCQQTLESLTSRYSTFQKRVAYLPEIYLPHQKATLEGEKSNPHFTSLQPQGACRPNDISNKNHSPVLQMFQSFNQKKNNRNQDEPRPQVSFLSITSIWNNPAAAERLINRTRQYNNTQPVEMGASDTQMQPQASSEEEKNQNTLQVSPFSPQPMTSSSEESQEITSQSENTAYLFQGVSNFNDFPNENSNFTASNDEIQPYPSLTKIEALNSLE